MAVARNNIIRQLMPGINALFAQNLNDFDMGVAKKILTVRGVDEFILYVTWSRSFQNIIGYGMPVIDRDALNLWPQLSAIDYDPDDNKGTATWRAIEMKMHMRSNLLLKEEGHA